ncbi:MAG: potassium channel protein [Sphingobacteriales bacterium JAD_PAG50586_3]|nr:MAG: potassium channel protein [Sphingobacteriales bacterium JAD_PAG50586_3]
MITITTIGYGEVVDLSNSPIGRLYTVFLALAGIALATYTISSVIAVFVDGRINKTYKYLQTMNTIAELDSHFIICGLGRIGSSIAAEMALTNRPFVVIERDAERVKTAHKEHPQWLIIDGEAADDEALTKAGILRCAGVFAATNDDNTNLVISLSAKQLNPKARVVSMCKDSSYINKITKAGADKVISPYHIGGLRMASEMVRPTVTSFLDDMLRDNGVNYRFEEFAIPLRFIGRTVADLNINAFEYSNFLALRTSAGMAIYKPGPGYVFQEGDVFIVITNPQERQLIEQLFGE